jgi:hypothetical protein
MLDNFFDFFLMNLSSSSELSMIELSTLCPEEGLDGIPFFGDLATFFGFGTEALFFWVP